MPASDGSDDFVGVCDPMEGLRLGIVILEEAVDGGLEVGDGSKHAAFETALRQCQRRCKIASLSGAKMHQ